MEEIGIFTDVHDLEEMEKEIARKIRRLDSKYP